MIVTTPDYLHDAYIVKALRAGCDVITEKPMTIDLGQAEAHRRRAAGDRPTGHRDVQLPLQPGPHPAQGHADAGAIGEITAVDFRWYLDRVHGADYFRRWHRRKDQSGGLLVHKATHHFDLVNWWVASRPETIVALGSRRFYRPERPRRSASADTVSAATAAPTSAACPYRLDIEGDAELKSLYLDAEGADDYFRDRCVFSSDITIEDTMQVQVGYANGVSMNYTLYAYSPWEGYEIVFYGTEGELNHANRRPRHLRRDERHEADDSATTTILHRHGEGPSSSRSGQAKATTAGETRSCSTSC